MCARNLAGMLICSIQIWVVSMKITWSRKSKLQGNSFLKHGYFPVSPLHFLGLSFKKRALNRIISDSLCWKVRWISTCKLNAMNKHLRRSDDTCFNDNKQLRYFACLNASFRKLYANIFDCKVYVRLVSPFYRLLKMCY